MTRPPSALASFYLLDKPVSANFVISCTGAFVGSNSSSRGISSPEDLSHLVHLRSQASAVIVGGNTARLETYSPTSRFETYVFSKGLNFPEGLTHLQFQNRSDLQQLFKEIAAKHKRVLVESGPRLLNQFLDERLIDTVFLSIVHQTENCTCALASLDDPKLIEALARSLLRIPTRARATSMISGRTVLTRFDCGEP